MSDRETLEVDVLIVGAGPAGLACAIRLRDWVDAYNQNNPSAPIEPPSVLVIEKGVSVGAHSISGAVFDPRALDELLPEWKQQESPVKQKVTSEEIWLLSPARKRKLPHALIPPYLHNDGNYVIALGELTPWLADHARKRGVEILEGVAGAEVLFDGEKVVGVRCQDSGVKKDGTPGESFSPGADLRAKITIFAEGARGSLTKPLIKRLALDADRQPQTYAIGIKELWEIPAANFSAGKVIHTLGFPLQKGALHGFSGAFGGSFIYGLDAAHLVIGLVVGLDYEDPALQPHVEFNRLKTHPEIKKLLAGGKAIAYGAKAIPEGGLYSVPQMYGDGFCLIGDNASLLNAARLKGVHLAMKSGMLAAEAAGEALAAKSFARGQLKHYDDLFNASWARDELHRVRNWRAGYARGIASGIIHDLTQRLTRGRGFVDPLRTEADFKTLEKISARSAGVPPTPADGSLTLDRASDVFLSGTNHAENQPCHLKVPDLKLCQERCSIEYGNPCQHFCPAAVYEWIGNGPSGHLQINPGNCVHCKTCDIKDPYENITWVVPEGGGGPRYNRL
ncbi:MAG TPA: electron transfer flavoprotein-ubiquinone oxidoreductase [Planctomycetota bacterium]|nr:electron transfer flavoprotein-ubiquinone oxidoreductase [Planctomycetota bacterium]